MYTSTRIDDGDVISSVNVGYEDMLEILAGGTGVDIRVDSSGELRVYNSGTVADVRVNSGGKMYLGDSIAAGIQVDAGGTAYITDESVVSGLTVYGGELQADRNASILGNIGISATKAQLSNITMSGAVTLEGATVTGRNANVQGSLYVYDTEATLGDISVTSLDIDFSDLIANRVEVKGNATFIDCDMELGELIVDGDTSITNTNASLDGFTLKGGVSLSSSTMTAGGNGTISGTLSLTSSATATIEDSRLTSASVGRASYLYLGNNVSAGTLAVGASGSASVEKAFVNLATVTSGDLELANTTVNNLSVNGGGSAVIHAGAVIKGMNVNDAASMTVEVGADIQHGYINAGATLAVNPGATLDNVFISSGCHINGFDITYSTGVGSGAILHYVNYGELLILDAAVAAYTSDATVYSGQIASDINVQYGAVANVLAGGLISGAIVNRNGDIQVSAGASAAEIAVSSAAKITVHNGAEASEIGVISGGTIEAYGTVNNNTAMLLSGANVNIHNGASVNAVAIDAGVNFSIEAGATLNGITAQSTQNMTGFNVSRAIVNTSAAIGMGQTADVLTVAKDAIFIATNGAEVTNAAVNGGYMYLTGALTGASVNENGTLRVLNGGKTDEVDVNAGWMFASNGATLQNTDIYNTGALHVSKGASVNATDIYAGWMFVSSGASATDVNVKGGALHVEEHGVVSSASVDAGWLFQSANAVVNGFVTDKELLHTNALIFSDAKVTSKNIAKLAEGDTAINTTLTKSATMIVEGGVASNTTFDAASWMFVSGGVAAGTDINNRGTLILSDNGKTTDTTVNYGWMMVSGGNAEKTTVNADGAVHVFDGGSVNDITVKTNGWMFVSGGNVNNAKVDGATIFVSGGSVDNAVVEYKGTVNVYDGAQVNNAKVNAGWMFVSSGAKANATQVGSWGALHVLEGGVAENSILDSGWSYVSKGGIIKNTAVLDRASLTVYEGAEVNGLALESGATLNGFTVKQDQAFTNFNVSGAVVSCNTDKAALYSNQSAVMTTVSSGAILRVNTGAVAWDTALDESEMIVSGGSAIGAGLVNGASLNASAAYLGNIQLYNGTALYGSAVVADNTTVYANGKLTAKAGAVLNNLDMQGGLAVVSRGVELNGIEINGGTVSAFSDIEGAVINGGVLSAGHGALLSDTYVGTGASLVMSGHVAHSGTMTISEGASVTAKNGAVIDFTVAGRTSEDGYLINNLDAITGSAAYTITVSGNEKVGTYALADNAASFSGTITVKDNNDPATVYGNLTVNGDKLYYNGDAYQLKLEDSKLSLVVSDIEDSAINANGVSQIVAYDAGRGAVGYVATSADAPAQWKGVWQWDYPDQWSAIGVGRFEGKNGSIETDGILIYDEKRYTLVAWTDISTPSYGQTDLGKLDKGFSVTGIANMDGDNFDDVIVSHENGSFGVMLNGKTFKSIWNVAAGESTTLKVIGTGSFGKDTESLVVLDTATNAVYLWNNNDTTFQTWSWSSTQIATLGEGWEIVAIGDFSGDGVDDIITRNSENNYMFAWEDGDSSQVRWVGATDYEIAAVGDYDGDNKDDLLLRETVSGWGGLGYWGAGYAGNWVDLHARVETDKVGQFAIIS